MIVKKIKGTHDFIFDEVNKWQYIETKIKTILDRYNFQEIRTPIIEYNEVFYRATPYVETVLKETYQFKDKKERIIVLRPEGTAAVIRSYIENNLFKIPHFYKFYYYGPFFRYERPQYGRYRQFHQLGAEIIGITNYLSEAEIIILSYDILSTLGLKKAKIKINTLGDLATRQSFLVIFKNYVQQYQKDLCVLCIKRMQCNLLRIFDCKICRHRQFLQKAPVILDHLTPASKKKFNQILSILQQAQVNLEIDPFLVRGLDYYTDTVFEITTTLKKNQNELVLGGGGNYNELTKLFGGSATNCMGFALGMERLIIALQDNNLLDHIVVNNLDVYMLVLDEALLLQSFWLMKKLRQNDIKIEMNYKLSNFANYLKKALKTNPKYLIFIGQKEIQNNKITVKKVSSRDVYILETEKVVDFFKKELCK
ncbi:histidine--tRNA ligase [Candidatus Phytoplasma melaleucae]|uniref:Histidine--tRNA ligase n=1 Tax=Candidatus Phytoplasma melaleucae TaxID=2982630 RepID=A0ABT9DCL0_9MOLU|nr:histidine--tRNA ligase ['Melaleuca sp.' phytoplasma]MDO8167881.1 histidine--tRNA ligase ['Melaleuca sp.' phytoplasma]